MKNKKTAVTAAKYIVISLVTIVMILPLVWLLSASFQGPGEIYKIPFSWIPKEFLFSNYASAWKMGHMGTAFFSSICISLIYIILHLTCCTLIGYVFAKYNFRFKNFWFMIVLLTMMIPQELTFFPIYGITKNLGILNSYFGVVFPFFISGFGVFFMRQFSAYVPNEIIEASEIDGCGNVKSFVFVALPLLKSAIAALTILAFSFIWDEFAWSKLVLSSPDKLSLPIQLSMLALSSTSEVAISELLAASVIAMIPVVILFILFQKQFIESITQSGVKG